MQVGDADGYGRYGILDETTQGLLCHECGRRYQHLASHITRGHKILVADYRTTHGLHASKPLVTVTVSGKMRDAWDKNSAQHLADLAAHRDPHRAAESSRATNRNRSAGARAGRVESLKKRRGRSLTTTEVQTLKNQDTVAQWCQVAYKILEDPSVSVRSLAQSAGIHPITAYDRLHRYRPDDYTAPGSGNRITP